MHAQCGSERLDLDPCPHLRLIQDSSGESNAPSSTVFKRWNGNSRFIDHINILILRVFSASHAWLPVGKWISHWPGQIVMCKLMKLLWPSFGKKSNHGVDDTRGYPPIQFPSFVPAVLLEVLRTCEARPLGLGSLPVVSTMSVHRERRGLLFLDTLWKWWLSKNGASPDQNWWCTSKNDDSPKRPVKYHKGEALDS